MDRRGFGASRDGSGYSAEREFSDVAAVVEAVAARAGQPVVLFGSSWGANCALGAARDLPTLRALILYEPSLGRRHAPGSLDRIDERIAAGDSEGVLIEMGTEAGLTGRSDRGTAGGTKLAPARRQRPTVVRKAGIEEGWNWQSDRFAGVAVSTLLLTGSE